MTTVYTSQSAASDPKAVGTHVFIVGVGEYPCLLGGSGRLLEDPMSLKQLSSPPLSAAALASWFLGRQNPSPAAVGFHNPNAPLATVELLLSPSQTYTRPDGVKVAVDPAKRANIAKAFSEWKERAAANADNVAVFYFCGHGVMGANDYLLPSDFGAASKENPWADAIDITETARAMRRLTSGPLYFLIDACRQASRDALSPGASPPALAYVDFKKPVQGFARLILWATGEGEAAFGAAGETSRFCTALIEALSGYEGEQASGGQGWVVTGDLLQRSVSTILQAGNAALEPEKRQYVERQLIGSQPFHFETAPPNRIVAGIPSSWTVGPGVREMVAAWGTGDALPNKVLEVLAEQLEAKNLQVQALQKEVKDWTQRYDELKRHLEAEPDSPLTHRARALLEEGKLREAGSAYEELIREEEARRDASNKRIAGYSLNRGRIFELDFKPLEALPCYEKAYRLCPDDPDCSLPYARSLLNQRDYRHAEPIYIAGAGRLCELVKVEPYPHRFHQLAHLMIDFGSLYRAERNYALARHAYDMLSTYRELAQANPAEYRRDVLIMLNDLGTLDFDEHRYAEARQAYEEALAITRELAKDDPTRLDVVTILNNLGLLHEAEQRFAEARRVDEEALSISRELAESNPKAYRPGVASTLSSLGNLNFAEHRYADAHQAYDESLAIYRELAHANPAAYRPDLASTLNNLGVLHDAEHRYAEARRAREEALAIYRELAQANPKAYTPDLAAVLNNLWNPNDPEHHYAEARQAYEEALSIRRDLAQANPAAYRPDLASTLNNLGVLHDAEHRYSEARQAYEEALAIRRELAQANPSAYRPDVARTLSSHSHKYGNV